jgi:hypothetical protein
VWSKWMGRPIPYYPGTEIKHRCNFTPGVMGDGYDRDC